MSDDIVATDVGGRVTAIDRRGQKHSLALALVSVGDTGREFEWHCFCSCGATWTADGMQSRMYLVSLFESHVKYYSRVALRAD